jgi:hypothetical protein
MKDCCFRGDSRQSKRLAAVSVVCLLLSILLYGCVSPTSVKNFNENREKYLLGEFDASKLSSGIRFPIEHAFAEDKKFDKVIMEFDETETNNGSGVVTHHSLLRTVYGRANGLILCQDEWAANGIPYRVNNCIQLLGLVNLDERYIFLQQVNYMPSPQDVVVKRIDSVDPSPVVFKEDSFFTLKYQTGQRAPLAPDNHFEAKYSFGQRFPASQINSAFQGEALNCEEVDYNDAGVVVSRSKSKYLINYGFAIVTEYSDSSTQIAYSAVKSVRFDAVSPAQSQ